MKKFLIFLLLLILVAGCWWLFKGETKPNPVEQKVALQLPKEVMKKTSQPPVSDAYSGQNYNVSSHLIGEDVVVFVTLSDGVERKCTLSGLKNQPKVTCE